MIQTAPYMNDVLLQLLDNANLLHGATVNTNRALRLSALQIHDVASQVATVTNADSLSVEGTTLSHSATLSLGGSRQPCASLPCRIRHIDELAQFAAFYSDRVYIHNFLSEHAHEAHDVHDRSLDELRYTLIDDLEIVARIRPLMEAGLVVPVTPSANICHQCVALDAFGVNADKRLVREQARLRKRFLAELKVSVEHADGEWVVVFEGPSELLEHGTACLTYDKIPAPLRKKERLLARARSGESVRLSRADGQKLEHHAELAGDVFRSVLFEMAVSSALGTSYLSEAELPIQVLSSISCSPSLDRRNNLIQRYLTSAVPFFGDIEPAEVVKLRQRETEAFVSYRQALNRAVDDVRARKGDFTPQDARGIYSDVVAPELARLDQAVKAARRDSLRTLGRSAGAWAGAISFGMYSGLLPAELLSAAKAVGLIKVVADLAQTGAKLADRRRVIHEESLYFLWRVRELVRRRSR